MSSGHKNYAGTKGVGYHWHRAAPAFLGTGVDIRVWRLFLDLQFRGSEPGASGTRFHFFTNRGVGFNFSGDSVSLRVWRFVVHLNWRSRNG